MRNMGVGKGDRVMCVVCVVMAEVPGLSTKAAVARCAVVHVAQQALLCHSAGLPALYSSQAPTCHCTTLHFRASTLVPMLSTSCCSVAWLLLLLAPLLPLLLRAALLLPVLAVLQPAVLSLRPGSGLERTPLVQQRTVKTQNVHQTIGS